MESKFDFISDITPEKESWTIVAKVVRLWLVADYNKNKLPYSMELVLMDDKGDKINASIRRTIIYKFDKDLKEGFVFSFHQFGVAANGGSYRTTHHSYKLNFQFATKVEKRGLCAVCPDIFSLVPIPDINAGSCDTDYLVDVMGLLTGFGTEKEYERDGKKTKINVIALEADGHKIECTLFGSYVDELNTFLASGDQQSAVVIIQLAKVKPFQDKIHLQNCMNCTKLIFNPDFNQAVLLRNRMIETMESPSQGLTQLAESVTVGLEDDFLKVTPMKTIEGLKDCKEEFSYVVHAIIKHILADDDWWYTACMCSKAVYPDHKMFFCEKCNRHVMKVVQRYRLKARVIDETDSATFVLFDRDCKMLFNKTCSEMFEAHESKSSGQGPIPKQISDLVDKTFLFKVDFRNATSSKFEQSFVVKKLCADQTIITKFHDQYLKSEDLNPDNAYLARGKKSIIECCDIDLAQNLMPKFSSAGVDNECQSGEVEGLDLSKDTEELTPLKRDFGTQKTQSDLELPLKMLKKSIKIEKD